MSKLTPEQARAILLEHGSYVLEICDGCGVGIGCASYGIVGDPRAWCTEKCREPFLPPHLRSSSAKPAPAPADPPAESLEGENPENPQKSLFAPKQS